MNENRHQILKWQQEGHINNDSIEDSLTLGGGKNTHAQWVTYLSRSVLWLGVMALASGIIFFFAYNWDDMSDSFKFSLVQALIVICLFFITQTKQTSVANTALVFLLSMLLGSLFALFGQTYQTGKDPWQLFFLWSICVIPLAFYSKSSSLWLMWLVLINLTLHLYIDVHRTFIGFLFFNRLHVMLVFVLINVFAAVLFEILSSASLKQIVNRIASQTAIVVSMIYISLSSLNFIFKPDTHMPELVIFLLWMPAIYYLYRKKSIDVLVMASWAVAAAVFILGLIGKAIGDDMDGMAFLIFGLLIIGSSTLIIKWLIFLLAESRKQEKGHE